MERCPCGSTKNYTDCCEPLIKGEREAQTAEELMRSRYAAYVKTEITYILETILPENRKNIDEQGIRKWSEKTDWKGLEIIKTFDGGAEDTTGTVEFIVHFKDKELACKHHEISKFKKHQNKWYYDDSEFPSPKQFTRTEAKVQRNDPCPCGSNKKYKKCCGKA